MYRIVFFVGALFASTQIVLADWPPFPSADWPEFKQEKVVIPTTIKKVIKYQKVCNPNGCSYLPIIEEEEGAAPTVLEPKTTQPQEQSSNYSPRRVFRRR